MDRINNLNAKPRLMLGFGIVVALVIAISALGIASLGNANSRVGMLYKQDMQGALLSDRLDHSFLTIGKLSRDAVLHADSLPQAQQDRTAVLAEFDAMHATLTEARKIFYTPQGLALISQVANALPAWEKFDRNALDRLDANDVAGAKAALERTIDAGKPLLEVIDKTREFKVQRAGEKYETGVREYEHTRTMLLGATALAILLSVTISLVIAESFARPLGLAVTTLNHMAEGDLTVSLDVFSKDEVGRMADAVNNTVQRLRATLQQVTAGSSNVNTASQELSAAAESLATGAQEQAASLEETAASLEQITATGRSSADSARQANQLSAGARNAAEDGQKVVLSAVQAMGEINTASARISDIISTIDEIAFQTNLLAVNAAVEAARAGEQGRGFAVVATEVRTLAQRSAGAAKEIKGLIQDSLTKVDRGTALVNRSGETLHGIVTSVKKTTDIVGEISSAVDEQTTGLDQVNIAVAQIDQVTQNNAAQTEELSSTANSLAEQSKHLLQIVSRFQLGESDHFALNPSTPSRPAAPPARIGLHRKASVSRPRGQSTSTRLKPVPAALLHHQPAHQSSAGDSSFEEF